MKDIELTVNKETGFVSNLSSYLIQQENLQRKIIFKFKEGFVDGNAYLCVEKDSQKGKIQLTKNNNQYETEIRSNIVNNTKSINLSFKIYEAENENEEIPIFVSKIVTLKVAETLVIDDELPEDLPTWQELVNGEISQLELEVQNLDDTKQNNLVSGSNIKTINNQSILGEGDISITAEEVNYNNILNKPQINNVTLSGNKTLANLGIQPAGNYAQSSDIPTNTSDLNNDSGFITNAVNTLTNYTLKTNTGSLIDLEINSNTYVITLSLKNQDGTIISTDTIDLPLESVVVGGSYDSTNQKIILTLENGNTVDILVGDLVAGLQTEITSQNKLASDLVDDTNSGNKFVTTSEKSTWNAKYDKPSGGIPNTDLASDVQTSLGKADSALQQHQDISGKEDKTNKTTTIDNESTNTQYPSAKSVYDYVEGLNTYSTDEVRIGTWIDDRPIYRKVFTVTNYTAGVGIEVNHEIENFDFAINKGGVGIRKDGKHQVISNSFNNSFDFDIFDISNVSFKYYIGSSMSGNIALTTIYLWLEYVKTTD